MWPRILIATALILPLYVPAARAFPGNNGLIAYSVDGQVHTVSSDGSGDQIVTSGRNPAWSAGASQLAYVCDLQICVSSSDGTNEAIVTSSPDGSAQQPAWSPDGGRIVFSRRIDPLVGDPLVELHLVDVDTGEEERLADSYSSDPAWSPDGERIVFTTGVSGTQGIYSVKPDGTGLKELFAPGRYLDSPVWSPNGKRVAFAYQKGSTWRIWAMRRNGRNPHQIFKGEVPRDLGQWSGLVTGWRTIAVRRP